jgi:hypothetical protein
LLGFLQGDSLHEGFVAVGNYKDGVSADQGAFEAVLVVKVGGYHLDTTLDERLSVLAVGVSCETSNSPVGIGGQGIDDA